jgi:ABC-type antimicrobial peptide transport system permease subunit
VTSSSHIALDAAGIGNVYLAAGGFRAAQFLVVRTSRPPGEMVTAVRRAVASLDPNQPVFLTATMRELVSDSNAGRRFMALLLGITGCLALLMSAAGVYGVASYTTSRRTREFGIRMAVGATPAHILSLVFREGFRTVTIGVALGLAAAALALTLLRRVIPGLESIDAGAVLTASFVVTSAATLACLIPARRATRTNPIAALRED